MSATAFARLSDAAGILPGYEDVEGGWHPTPPETARAILAALGLEAADEAEAEASLARLEEAPWRRTLPPLAFSSAGLRPVLSAVFEGAEVERGVPWTLVTERGESSSGWLSPLDLRCEAVREVEGRSRSRWLCRFPFRLPAGIYRLSLGDATTELAVAPSACYLPPALEAGGRAWGLTAQLYALRSQASWGIGDYGDLARLARMVGRAGGAVLGLNPLHALYPETPAHASPYSPSSRRFYDVLALDLATLVPEQALTPAQRERIAALEAQPMIDRAAVAALKRPLMEQLWQDFRSNPAHPQADAFRAYQQEGGRALKQLGCFQALAERYGTGWRNWPAEYRHPDSPAVAAFGASAAERVGFFQYLQFLAEQQLAAAAQAGRAAGLSIGLYLDLALAVDGAGLDSWALQDAFVPRMAIGAPPDAWNAKGQNWGLPPLSPLGQAEQGYRVWRETLAANMRHSGALRIDHAMGLSRLFWIPAGQDPAAGAYVRQPQEDLLRLLALASHRHQCLVIGEDLGTVAKGFRERMAQCQVLSYRLLLFETDAEGGFAPPAAYPALATAAFSTHDLATLAGFLAGRDLDWRERLGLYPDPAMASAQRSERSALCEALRRVLHRWGGLPEQSADCADLLDAVCRFLARTPALLALLQLEDAMGAVEQVNLPGTVDEHPNWLRRLPRTLEDFAADPAWKRLAGAMART